MIDMFRDRPSLYILDADGTPVAVFDGDYMLEPARHRQATIAWSDWMATGQRIVRQTQIGPYWVSTVFLGIDHAFTVATTADYPPVLWETMVFAREGKHGSPLDMDCRRYQSRAEAEEGHQTTCMLVALEVERQEGTRPTMVDRALAEG